MFARTRGPSCHKNETHAVYSPPRKGGNSGQPLTCKFPFYQTTYPRVKALFTRDIKPKKGKKKGGRSKAPSAPALLRLCSHLPGSKVLLLLRRERVYLHSESGELEPRYLLVDLDRHRVNLVREGLALFHQEVGRQRLIREAHV